MKFKPSLKFAKASILAAMTITSAIVSNGAPSQAAFPDGILSSPGKPDIALFGGRAQVVELGCTSLRNMWNEIPTKANAKDYENITKSPFKRLSRIDCNAPNSVKGYTSSGFGKYAGVIVAGKTPFYVSTTRFFDAIGIIPTQLNVAQTNQLYADNPDLDINTVLEQKGNFIPAPAPRPAPTPISLPILFPYAATRIISHPGKAVLVIFGETMESFPIGCPALRNLWSGIRTEAATLDEYNNMTSMKATKFGIAVKLADLYCNNPVGVKAYTSPLFGNYAGAIVTDGKPYFVQSTEFFTAMGITPVKLNDQQARDFVNNTTFRSSTLLTTKK